jgi:hypothetical protein
MLLTVTASRTRDKSYRSLSQKYQIYRRQFDRRPTVEVVEGKGYYRAEVQRRRSYHGEVAC